MGNLVAIVYRVLLSLAAAASPKIFMVWRPINTRMRSVIEGTKGNCDEHRGDCYFWNLTGRGTGRGLDWDWDWPEHGIYLCTGFLALPNSSLLSSSSSSLSSLFLFPLGGTIVIVVGVPRLETEAEASSAVCGMAEYIESDYIECARHVT